jgi:hypothetical protein
MASKDSHWTVFISYKKLLRKTRPNHEMKVDEQRLLTLDDCMALMAEQYFVTCIMYKKVS